MFHNFAVEAENNSNRDEKGIGLPDDVVALVVVEYPMKLFSMRERLVGTTVV